VQWVAWWLFLDGFLFWDRYEERVPFPEQVFHLAHVMGWSYDEIESLPRRERIWFYLRARYWEKEHMILESVWANPFASVTSEELETRLRGISLANELPEDFVTGFE
jgi:hypothetical protein